MIFSIIVYVAAIMLGLLFSIFVFSVSAVDLFRTNPSRIFSRAVIGGLLAGWLMLAIIVYHILSTIS